MKTKLLIASMLAGGLWLLAQDAEPEPTTTETVTSVTQIEPPTLSVTVVLSPVVKKNGTNTANIVSVTATKQRVVRKLVNGVQVGDAEVRKVEAPRDILANLLTRTNANGILALNLSPDRATMLWNAYNKTPPTENP